MNKNPLMSTKRRDRFVRVISTATLMAVFTLLGAAPAMLTVNADVLGGFFDSIMGTIETGADYIGAVMAIWAGIQIYSCIRREDSEGISKHGWSSAAGALLIGADSLIDLISGAID